MTIKTEKGISRRLKVMGELEARNYHTRSNITGSAAGVGFDRGETPRETRIVQYSSGEKPNITGSAAGVGFGRGGVPKETSYISYKMQKEEGDEQRC